MIQYNMLKINEQQRLLEKRVFFLNQAIERSQNKMFTTLWTNKKNELLRKSSK